MLSQSLLALIAEIPDEIAYISPVANRFLPDDLSKFKVFILHASDVRTTTTQNSMLGSLAAALTDKLPVYRLPIERHVT